MHQVKPEVREDIVEMLEGLLEEAKRGEVQGIAITGATHNGATFNCFAIGGHVMALLGEHRVLERDMIDCTVDIRRKPRWEFCE